MLPTNLGQGLVLLTAILLGVTLPILPGQVLWINLTTAGVLGLVLALEPREPGLMRRSPRAPDAPILTRAMALRVLLVGAMILVGAFGLFEWALSNGDNTAVARTIAVNTVVMIQLFYVFNCRSLTQSVSTVGWFSNPWVFIGSGAMIALQLFFTYAPIMNDLFGTAPIAAQAWIVIVALGFLAFVIIELVKWIGRRGMPAQPRATASSANSDAAAPVAN
jgi:Ca2+-transporting ATPase